MSRSSILEGLHTGRISESSVKISDMTKSHGNMFTGYWKLPSGKPGLVASDGDVELYVLSSDEEIQVILMFNDGDMLYKSYGLSEESKALKDFKEITKYMNGVVDCWKLAKKFGLK